MEAILDEIGLSGLEGCTIEELWTHLDTRQPPFCISLTTPTSKEYVWKQILEATTTQLISLYKTPYPKPVPEPEIIHQLVGSTLQRIEYIPSHGYQPVTGVNGSCSNYEDRVDVTNEILNLSEYERTLENIHKRYDEKCLIIVGNTICRQRALIPPHIDPSLSLTAQRYCILEIAGRARSHGIFRTNLTHKYMNIDSRSTFNFVKLLTQTGLITIKTFLLRPLTGGSSQNVHIIFLKRFGPKLTDINQEKTKEQIIVNLLSSSPDLSLPITEIRKHIGNTSYKRAHATLTREGVIESINKPLTDDDSSSPTVRIIKLIKPIHQITEQHYTEQEEETEDINDDIKGKLSPVVELPLFIQGYRLIHDCGPGGITMTDFNQNGLKLNHYTCRSLANVLIKQSHVISYLSDIDKSRVLNLISKRQIDKNKDITELNAELSNTQTTPLATPLRTGMDVYHPPKRPHPPSSNSGNAKKYKLDLSTDNGEEQGEVPEVILDENTEQQLSYRQIKRLHFLSNFVKENKIFEGHVVLVKYLSEREKIKPDRRVVKRLIQKLIDNNIVRSRDVTVPCTTGNKTVTIYYDPCVTENEQQQFIDNKLSKTSFVKRQRTLKIISKERIDVKPQDITTSHSLYTSKFQRIKHLHFYMWILLNKPKSQESLEESQESQESTSLWNVSYADMLPESSFPWLQGVTQLPALKENSLSFNDILFHMPLSLLLILSRSLSLNQVNKSILYDTAYSTVPLHSLPHNIQYIISRKNQEQLVIVELLKVMELMNLITISGPYKTLKERQEVTISLNYNLIIINTTCTKPRNSFFTNEARDHYPLIHYNINTLQQLQHYWYTLQQICLTTPIKISKRQYTCSSDEYSLKYSCDNRSDYDELGFGAGGLPPSTFSHLSINWSILHKKPTTSIGMSPSTGIGMSLEEIPHVVVQGHNVPAHSGGKGLTRHRVKKALKNAHKMKLKLKEQSKVIASLTSLMPLKGGIGTVDVTALQSRSSDRSVWYNHEDNYLLMSYIATLVLHKLGHPPTEQYILRDSLHSKFKTSQDKTVQALHRRLVKLIKIYTRHNLNVCVSEIIEEMDRLKETGPEHTFHSLLEFILQRYISHDGHVINISLQSNDVLLPHTLQDCTNNSNNEVGSDKFDSLTSNQKIVLNIILFSAGPDTQLFDTYTVYRLLEQYPESDIIAAIECLKSQSFVVHKKLPLRRGHDNKRFTLGTSFHQLFEGLYNKDIFDDIKRNQSLILTHIDTNTVNSGLVSLFINNSFHPQTPLIYTIEPIFPDILMITDKEEDTPTSSSNVIQSLITSSEDNMSKSGIGTLMQIDDSAILQHGHITVIGPPTVNIGSLLDPLNDETPPITATPTFNVTSLETFLQYATSSLYYTPVTMTTTQQLYTLINNSQSEGVTMATLRETCNDIIVLNTILRDLINFKLVYRVGTVIALYITHTYHTKWIYTCTDDTQEELTLFHPWIQREEAGSIIINELIKGVLMYIISKPGVAMDDLYCHFKYILQYTSLQDILEVLLTANCIIKYTLHDTSNSTPFSGHTSSIITSCHDDDPMSSVCYEATVWAEASWVKQF